jgi:hypothetical protein
MYVPTRILDARFARGCRRLAVGVSGFFFFFDENRNRNGEVETVSILMG